MDNQEVIVTPPKKWGGKRHNSGRKPSLLAVKTSTDLRKILIDRLAENDYKDWYEIVNYAIAEAKKDRTMAGYLMDQLMGKALQNIDGELDVKSHVQITLTDERTQITPKTIRDISGE